MEESFSQLEERAKRATTIEELFCLWKRAHAAEVDEKTAPNTCPFPLEDKARKNFTVDGRLGEMQKGGVLFICKESNLSRDEDAGVKAFWLRDEVVRNQPSTSESADVKRAKTKYRNCLSKTLNKLLEKEHTTQKNLEDCAYMNLNKRGRCSKCDNLVLAAYIAKYKDFIRKEIELLQCDTVVLYSASCYTETTMGEIEDVFRSAGVKTVAKIDCHPSRYSNQKIENMEITKNP